jgi:site-specific recombinase XerD
MDKTKIADLVNAVLAELKRLGYSEETVLGYKKVFNSLIQYSNSHNKKEYSIELIEKYLREVKNIDLLGSSQNSDRPQKKSNYLPIRACHCLAEWHLHKYISQRKPGLLPAREIPKQFKICFESYVAVCKEAGYSERGTHSRLYRIKRMLFFFNDKGICDINKLIAENISAFFKTQINLESRTVAGMLSTIRVFFRHLYQRNITREDFSTQLPIVKANRNYKIPRIWQNKDIKVLLESIDRGNPTGKRDFAILMLITRYGLRSADVKDLTLSNLQWNSNTIEIVQSKTKNPLLLPLRKDVGWAIIDYLQHGRPVSDYPNVFITNTIPHRPFGTNSGALNAILRKHILHAGVKIPRDVPKGVHSLRHTLASAMLAKNVPLPVISAVLGHVTQKATDVYLHIDIECAYPHELS